jgi:hypothetical protein
MPLRCRYGHVVNVYPDHETAQSAVRNLNGKDVGGRPLRIDLADSDPLLEGRTTSHGELLDDRRRPPPPAPSTESWLAGLPQGPRPPPGKSSTDVITDVLASIRPEQAYDVLRDMKVCPSITPPRTSRTDGASVENYEDFHTATPRSRTYSLSSQPTIGVRTIPSRLGPQCHRSLCYPCTLPLQVSELILTFSSVSTLPRFLALLRLPLPLPPPLPLPLLLSSLITLYLGNHSRPALSIPNLHCILPLLHRQCNRAS